MKMLPARPNLHHLSREAKALKSSHRNGDTSVRSTIGHFDISLHGLSSREILDTRFSILDAQRVVARLYGFSSWSRLKKFVLRCEKGRSPSDTQLRRTVLHRHETLDGLMQKYRRKEGDHEGTLRQYRELALESTTFLDSAFERHGWPGPDVVGPDCIWPLTFLAANATFDAAFQDRSTRLMAEALPHGGICAHWHATLRDRYLVLSGKPSVHGTSFDAYHDADGRFRLVEYDVIDPANLDRRRAQVGYESVETARRRLEKRAVAEGWPMQTYEQCVADFESTAREGGYRSRDRTLPIA